MLLWQSLTRGIRVTFGSLSGHIRVTFGSDSGHIPVAFWVAFGSDPGHIRVTFWSDSGRIQVAFGRGRVGFGSDSDRIRVVFGSHSGHVRVRFESHSGGIRLGFGWDSGRIRVTFGLCSGRVWVTFGWEEGAGGDFLRLRQSEHGLLRRSRRWRSSRNLRLLPRDVPSLPGNPPPDTFGPPPDRNSSENCAELACGADLACGVRPADPRNAKKRCALVPLTSTRLHSTSIRLPLMSTLFPLPSTLSRPPRRPMGTRWTRRSSMSGTRTCSSKSASWRGRRGSSQSPRGTLPATATVSTLAVTPSVVVDAPEDSPLIWVSTLAVTPSVVVDAPEDFPFVLPTIRIPPTGANRTASLRVLTVRRFLLSIGEKNAKCSGGELSSLVVEGIIGLNKGWLTAGRLALSTFLCGTLDTVGDLEGDVAQYCCNAPLPSRCACKAEWEYAGQSFKGCANPDDDFLGTWYTLVLRVSGLTRSLII
eukprot:1196021-Prorocentrum_minimum.AAC.3